MKQGTPIGDRPSSAEGATLPLMIGSEWHEGGIDPARATGLAERHFDPGDQTDE
jgi:hypothetical protein